MLSAKHDAEMTTEAEVPLYLINSFITTATIWRNYNQLTNDKQSALHEAEKHRPIHYQNLKYQNDTQATHFEN